jgi:hypothetical protein
MKMVVQSTHVMTMSRLLAVTAALAFAAVANQASAIVYDLNASRTVVVDTVYGDAVFTLDYTKPAGTGVFDPFLTIQANGVEQGYNSTSGNFDTKREPTWNHEIKLSDLTSVTVNGVSYYSFLIDINEPNTSSKSLISLDSLKLYTSATKVGSTTNLSDLGTLRFDLDVPTDTYIKYNDLNSGSGEGDIAFFIPTSAFAGAKANDYVYLYEKFGSNYSADLTTGTQGGFEETALGNGISFTPVPETNALLPLIGVLGTVIASPFVRRAFRS